MSRRAVLALVTTLAASAACAQPQKTVGVTKELELGPHRVQLSPPAGWDVLDQGAQKRVRKGESEILLENLGKIEWDTALASLQDDRAREVKSRRSIAIDYRDAQDIETWSRLDHTWPQRLLFVRVDDDLLALSTPRLADPDTQQAFDSVRDSLHFTSTVRR